ncbi:MAG: hypothetical protein ABI462_11770 [Ignavibacteria bacterium]
MCRLLLVKSDELFEAKTFLEKFSEVSKNSSEFQGHGWGCSMLVENEWKHYKSIKPVWEDDLSKFGKASLLIAHARSAFNDDGISVENNMPFYDDKYIFIFNGELRGVKIKSEGRIGAEKIFNFIIKFDKGNIEEAIIKGVNIINRRTAYVRAMNFIIADKENVYLYSKFGENPEYFTVHFKSEKQLVICSEKFPGENDWVEIENNSLNKF